MVNRTSWFIKYWFPVILYAVLIYILSSMPESPAPMPFPYCDKVYHILEYAVLGFLLLRALSYSKASLAGVDLRLVAFLLAALYGVTDEIHQYFVPTRHLEALDIISNSIGAYLGQIFFKIKN